MKIYFLLLLVLPVPGFSQLYANRDAAIIEDPDGFTLMRSKKDVNSAVIDTLFEGEFFHYIPTDTSNWYEVYKIFTNSGFVHKSSIRNLKKLQRHEQYVLLDSIFTKEIKYYRYYSDGTKEQMQLAGYFHDAKFSPVLDLFIYYMCDSYDEELLKKFFDLLILESGSADELPPTALGYVYVCQPDKVLEMIKVYKKSLLLSHLEFGFGNIAYGRKDEIDNFDELDQKLKDLSKSFSE